MPQSITQTVFGGEADHSQPERKRKFSYLERPTQNPNSSLLTRLGKVFSIFLYEAKPKLESSLGIFTSPDQIEPSGQKVSLSKRSVKNRPARTRYSSADNRAFGDIKRLVIASKPEKFHLIDTDKVFKPKRRRVVSSWTMSSGKTIEDDLSSSDDDDTGISSRAKFPYRINTTENLDSAPRTFEGDASVTEKPKLATDSNALGYWCTPSTVEIEKMTFEELANIENFIIGRKGYGQIAYNHPIDLVEIVEATLANGTSISEAIFGNIVQILDKHTIVYENLTEKPPIGFGLNVPATITLERMIPKENMSTNDYINLLKRQKGMEFVNYDPITYVWTFRVKHFSIWGLVDDDDNNDNNEGNLSAKKRLQDSKEHEAELEYTKIYEDKRYNKELRNQKLSQLTRGLPGGWKHSHFSTSSPISIKRQLVASEIDNNLKGANHDNKARKLSEQISDITIDLDQSVPPSPNFLPMELVAPAVERRNEVDYLKNLVSILPRNQDMEDIVQEKAFEPEVANDALFQNIQNVPNVAVASDWLVQMEMSNDYNSALLPYAATTDIISLKTDFEGDNAMGQLDKALFADFNKKAAEYKPTNSTAKDTQVIPKRLEELTSVINNLIDVVNIQSRDNGFPQIFNQQDLTFAKLGNQVEFTLASALFDSDRFAVLLDSLDMGVVARQETLKQRTVFQDWLVENLLSVAEKQTDGDCFQQIINCLVVGDVKGAVLTAQETSNPHLSVVLTLADSNDEAVRGIASNQLAAWKGVGGSMLAPPGLVRIYKLLSGDVDAITDSSWQQILAANFFYGPHLSLLAVIGEVVSRFRGNIEPSAIFDILELYVHVSENGKKGVTSWILEAGWPIERAWLFSLVLSPGSSSLLDDLSTKLGDILQNYGLWREAVFAYSYLENDNTSRSKITACVINHMPPHTDELVIRQLRIPESLLYESAAIDAKKEGSYWQACRSYISAKEWHQAHECIVSYLGPEVIISNDKVKKSNLLDLTDRFPDKGLVVPSWSQGAGLYTRYISLVDGSDKLVVDDLLTNIPHFIGANNFRTRVALHMMSRKVGDAAIDGRISNYKSRIMALKLGQNERNYFECRLAN